MMLWQNKPMEISYAINKSEKVKVFPKMKSSSPGRTSLFLEQQHRNGIRGEKISAGAFASLQIQPEGAAITAA
jgi:hypothetical protein